MRPRPAPAMASVENSMLPRRCVESDPLGTRELLERRLRHAGFPSRVAQFEAVAAGIEKIKLPAGEEAFGSVVQPVDAHLSLLENFAGLHQSFRRNGERVVHVLVLDVVLVDARRALAEQNIIVADVET